MSIDKILREQRKWLDEATRRVEKPDAPERTLAMPAEIRERRTGEIEARIERLEAQKQAAIRRYDAAIAAEVAEKEQLARDIDWEKDGPRVSSGTDAVREDSDRAKRAAGAGAKVERQAANKSAAAPTGRIAKKPKTSAKGRSR